MKIVGILLGVLLAWGCVSVQAEEIKWPTEENLKSVDAENIYDRPYSLWESRTDKTKIIRNTGVMFGASFGAMGILYMLPSSFTNWDDDARKRPWKKWGKNVSREPVWDKDDFFLNYVTHPYFGAVYYMGARSAGAGAGYAFLYSFMLSTFFWEYGVEALAERPSIQDLIVTPGCGAILGEGFYLAKRHIKDNDDELLGSRILGKTTMFLMDPITEITDWIFEDKPETKQSMSFSSQPMISTHSIGYGLSMKFNF